MNDAIEAPIAEHVANIPESFRTGGITVSATPIYVKINYACSHHASGIAPRLSMSRPSAIIVESQSARTSIIAITAPSSPQRTPQAFNHPEAHTTILRPPVGSQSAAGLPLNKDPGVTDLRL
jgi:hypothetical protein